MYKLSHDSRVLCFELLQLENDDEPLLSSIMHWSPIFLFQSYVETPTKGLLLELGRSDRSAAL